MRTAIIKFGMNICCAFGKHFPEEIEGDTTFDKHYRLFKYKEKPKCINCGCKIL